MIFKLLKEYAANLVERLKLCRKFGIKITWDALTAKRHAVDDVMDVRKFKAFVTGILEAKLQDHDDEKQEKELVNQMANMQVEKK